MKIQTKLNFDRITISEPQIDDVYYIEQADNGRFYVTSKKGYNGYEMGGYAELTQALAYVKKTIKNYFIVRCEPEPAGW